MNEDIALAISLPCAVGLVAGWRAALLAALCMVAWALVSHARRKAA